MNRIEERGLDIYNRHIHEITIEYDEEEDEYVVKVPSQSHRGTYDVTFKPINIEETEFISYCECPYFFDKAFCKHLVAAEMVMEEAVGKAYISTPMNSDMEFEMEESGLEKLAEGKGKGKLISNKEIAVAKKGELKRDNSNTEMYERPYPLVSLKEWEINYKSGRHLSNANREVSRITLEDVTPEKVTGSSVHSNVRYSLSVSLQKNHLSVGCTCREMPIMFCQHALAMLVKISRELGQHHFKQFMFEDIKRKKLEQYGLKPEDAMAKKFEWELDYSDNPVLKHMPEVLKVNDENYFKQLSGKLRTAALAGKTQRAKPMQASADSPKGCLLFETQMAGTFLSPLRMFSMHEEKGKRTAKLLNTDTQGSLNLFNHLDDEQYKQLEAFTDASVQRWLNERNELYAFTSIRYQKKKTEPLLRYYFNKLVEAKPLLSSFENLYALDDGVRFSAKQLQKAVFRSEPVSIRFVVKHEENFLAIVVRYVSDGKLLSETAHLFHELMVRDGNSFYLFSEFKSLQILALIPDGKLLFTRDKQLKAFGVLLPMLSEVGEVENQSGINFHERTVSPVAFVEVSELNNAFLIFKPKFDYEGITTHLETQDDIVRQTETGIEVTKRDTVTEQSVLEFIKSLHKSLVHREDEGYVYLSFDAALRDLWFVKAVRQLNEAGINVLGIDKLKRFRYNTTKPKMNLKPRQALIGSTWR